MSININHIAFPFFQITKNFTIINRSPKCDYLFNPTNNFLELIDSESLEKFHAHLIESKSKSPLEINMITKNNPPCLFKMECTFVDNKEYYVFCQPINEEYVNLQYELFQLKESIVNMDEQSFKHLEQYSLTQSNSTSVEKIIKIDNSKRLDSIRRSTSSIIDLLGVITNTIIEDGKSDYLELMYDELRDIKSLVDELKSSIN